METMEDNNTDRFRANMFTTALVRYSLYRSTITYSPGDAVRLGTTKEDIGFIPEGLLEGWPESASAHRAEVNARMLVVIESPNKRGAEPEHVTAARVKVVKRDGVSEVSDFSDYEITVDTSNLPAGMSIHIWADGKMTHVGTCSDVEPTWGFPVNPATRKVMVYLFDVKNSNPNGDPDNEGRPRQDDVTGKGYITDTCIKRKIRDLVSNRYKKTLFYAHGTITKDTSEKYARDMEKMAVDLWDMRLFGGMVPKAKQKLRGPVRVTYAESIDEIDIVDVAGTSVTGHDGSEAKEAKAAKKDKAAKPKVKAPVGEAK